MATSVGDVVVGLRLDAGGFDAGTAAALRSAQRLGQIVDQFGRPMGAVAKISDEAGAAITRTGGAAQVATGHFANASAQVARFAAIGLEQVVPAAEGSRVAIEGAFQAVGKLAGGYSTLVIGAVGLAGILGGYLYSSLTKTTGGAKSATESIKSIGDAIGEIEKDLPTKIEAFDKMSRTLERLRRQGAGGTFSQSKEFREAQAGALGRERIRDLGGAAILEDPAAGPAGSIANKMREDAAKSYFELEKAVKAFVAAGAAAAVDDPLQRMLIEDWKQAQELLDKIREITDPALRSELAGMAAAAGGQRQIGIRDAYNSQNFLKDKGAADRLGLGDTGLIRGLGDIQQLNKDVDAFRGTLEALARSGTPVAELFPQIAEGQAKVNEKIVALKEKYADTPAIFNKLVEMEKQIGNNELQRGLDGTVRSLQGVKDGTVTIIDTAEGLETRYTPALSNAGTAGNFLAGVLYEDMPKAALAADKSMVTLTANANLLAEALARAYWNALSLSQISVANAGVATAPGNF